MKPILFALGLLGCSVGAFAQGTVVFNNHVSTVVATRVYAPVSWGMPMIYGNTATDTPPGSQTYLGAPLTGSQWRAQLFALPGNVIPAGPLLPYGVPVDDHFVGASPTTSFRTGTAAGVVAATTATLPNVLPDATSAVLQLRVFPAEYGTWAATVDAFNQGRFVGALGASPMFVLNAIGGEINTPPNLIGLQSFSLVGIPEPTSLALVAMASFVVWLSPCRRWLPPGQSAVRKL